MSFIKTALIALLLAPSTGMAQGIDDLYRDARVAEEAGNWVAAVDIYGKIIMDNPEQSTALFALSKASLKIDDLRGAQKNIIGAIEKDPHNENYRAFADEIGKITNGLKDGRRSHDNRDYPSAIRKYDALLAEYPEFATLHYYKGLSLQGSGSSGEAVESFRTARQLNPREEKYSKAMRTMAVRQYQEGERFYRIRDWAPAQEHFETALDIDPTFSQGYYRLARTLSQQGLVTQALDILEKSIRTNPAYLTAYLEKGNILRSEQRFKEAASAYRAALSVDSDAYRAMVGLGQSLKAENPAQASKHLKAALALKPDNITANEMLGEIYSEQEKYLQAKPYLEKAVELKPDDHVKLWRLAYVENNLGNFESAKLLARKSVGIDNKFQPGWFELGKARKELNEIPGAVAAFKKAETGSDRSTAADASRERKQMKSRGK